MHGLMALVMFKKSSTEIKDANPICALDNAISTLTQKLVHYIFATSQVLYQHL